MKISRFLLISVMVLAVTESYSKIKDNNIKVPNIRVKRHKLQFSNDVRKVAFGHWRKEEVNDNGSDFWWLALKRKISSDKKQVLKTKNIDVLGNFGKHPWGVLYKIDINR